MILEHLQDKLADVCNSLLHLSFKPSHRQSLLTLLNMTENLRNLLVERIDACDRQKPD